MIYVLILFLVVLISIGCHLASCELYRYLKFGLLLVLFVPASLRYGIGIDYLPVYIPTVMDIQSGEETGQEMSYVLIVKFCQMLTSSPQLVIAIYAFLTYLLVIYSFDKAHIAIGVIATFLLQYFPSYNIIRQSLAISCLMVSFRLFSENRYFLCVILALIAGSFHTSSFIFLPILLFAFKFSRLSRAKILVLVIIGLLLAYFIDPTYLVMKVSEISKKYIQYSDSVEFMEPAHLSSGIGEALYVTVDILLMIGLLYAAEGSMPSRVAAILCGVAAVVEVSGLHLEILMRVTHTTNFILPYAASDLYVKSNKEHRYKYVCFFCIGVWMVIFFRGIIISYLGGDSPHGVIPYTSILSI